MIISENALCRWIFFYYSVQYGVDYVETGELTKLWDWFTINFYAAMTSILAILEQFSFIVCNTLLF